MIRFSLRLILLSLCVVVLAACGGGEPSPTATVPVTPSNTPDPSAEPTIVSPFGTLPPAATDIPEIGPPPEMTGVDDGVQPGGVGTLVAVGTPDPSLPAGFDQIVLIRTGGPAGPDGVTLDETIIIERSGEMTRNGARGRASDAAVASIGAMIDSLNIFAIQANFVGALPLEGPQPYTYQLLIVKGEAERLFTAQDGMMPREFEQLLVAVLSEGMKISRP